MKSLLTKFVGDESGATAVEYGLIAGLVAVVTISALQFAGITLSTIFTTASDALAAAAN